MPILDWQAPYGYLVCKLTIPVVAFLEVSPTSLTSVVGVVVVFHRIHGSAVFLGFDKRAAQVLTGLDVQASVGGAIEDIEFFDVIIDDGVDRRVRVG